MGEGGPLLTSRFVALRPVATSDYSALHALETSSPLAWRWRQRGRTASPEEFVRGLWTGVLAQFIVVRNDGRPLGLVLAFDADHINGIARFAVLKFDLEDSSPRFLVGCGMFLDYLFYWWPLRKLYAEATETNFKQFASGERLGYFQVEGRLVDYAFRAGVYEDVLIISITRDVWASSRANRLGFA